jgi:hypothetical protein
MTTGVFDMQDRHAGVLELETKIFNYTQILAKCDAKQRHICQSLLERTQAQLGELRASLGADVRENIPVDMTQQ